MLSGRIDLTANHDFRGSQTITEMDITVFDRWYSDGPISNEEYDYLSWWEGMFGRTRHTNEKRRVFGDDKRYEEEMRCHCYRCGIELKMPWNRFYGLCRECNDVVDSSVQRIPWKVYRASSDRRNEASEVFNLR